MALQEESIHCPYCGELITILLDEDEEGSRYIEDCQVCCRPIEMTLYRESSGALSVAARHENDA